MRLNHKKISEYIDDLNNALQRYTICIWNQAGKYQKDNLFDNDENNIKFDVHLPSNNKDFLTVIIDDYIPLNQEASYHVIASQRLTQAPAINTIYTLTLKLNVFKLKKELNRLAEQGYKIILDSDESEDNEDIILKLSSTKRKGLFGKADKVHKAIERGYIDVLVDIKSMPTIEGRVNTKAFPYSELNATTSQTVDIINVEE